MFSYGTYCIYTPGLLCLKNCKLVLYSWIAIGQICGYLDGSCKETRWKSTLLFFQNFFLHISFDMQLILQMMNLHLFFVSTMWMFLMRLCTIIPFYTIYCLLFMYKVLMIYWIDVCVSNKLCKQKCLGRECVAILPN